MKRPTTPDPFHSFPGLREIRGALERHLMRTAPLTPAGVLIYGSRVGGDFRADSDVDLILIGNMPQRRFVTELDGVAIDTLCISARRFEKKILERSPLNNNLFVEAVATGHLLRCESSHIAEIHTKASEIYRCGPPLLSIDDLGNLNDLVGLTRHAASCALAKRDDEDDSGIRFTLDRCFRRLVYIRNSLRGRWGTAFSKMAARLRAEPASDFQSIWLDYRGADGSLTHKRDLVHAACNCMAEEIQYHIEHLNKYEMVAAT